MLDDSLLLHFDVHANEFGNLVSLQENDNIPFTLARVYYIYGAGAKGKIRRGLHAHHNLQQVLICVGGAFTMLMDDGKTRREYRLQSPKVGLYIDHMMWHEMYDFSDDCIIMVLANAHYDKSDYIYDYDIFLQEVAAKVL